MPNYITEVAAPCFTVTGETFKITHKCSFDSGYLWYLFVSLKTYPKHYFLVKVKVQNQI